MRPAEQQPKPRKYLTTEEFAEYIQQNFLPSFKRSRLHKDAMERDGRGRVAPRPAARYGNRDLYTEDQAPPYVAKLVKELRPEGEQNAAQ